MCLCKYCGFQNFDGTRYCQKCGKKIIRKGLRAFFRGADFSNLAGMGARGVSIAPLGKMAVDNLSKQWGNKKNPSGCVKVVPLEDGSWYCPDCGFHNARHALYCGDCGRYK